MNIKKRRVLSVSFLLIFLIISGVIIYWKCTKFEFAELPDGTLEVVDYNGRGKVARIPSTFMGKKVTKINNMAFFETDGKVKKIVIPDSIVEIDFTAFRGSPEITEDVMITGGKNIEVIGNAAFFWRDVPNELELWPSLKRIGFHSFCRTTGIRQVHLPEGMEYIGTEAFAYSDLEEIYIPDSVSYIGIGAFRGTPWLEKQEGFVIVGDKFLIDFPKEEVVVIPEGVETISASVPILGDYEEDKKIKEIYVPKSVKQIVPPIIGESGGDLRIYLPDTLERVEGDVYFKDGKLAYGMESVTLIVEKDSYAEKYAKECAEKFGTRYEVVDKIVYPE